MKYILSLAGLILISLPACKLLPGGTVGNGIDNDTIAVLGKNYRVAKLAGWKVQEEGSDFTVLSSETNEIRYEYSQHPCEGSEVTKFEVKIAQCDQNHTSLTLSDGKVIQASYKMETSDISEMLHSFRPVFKEGRYRLTIQWNTPPSVALPPPYVGIEPQTSTWMNILQAPLNPSKLDSPMEGFHGISFDYLPSEKCTRQGLGYTWENGKFWFANCDPRGVTDSYKYEEIFFYYLEGVFNGVNSGSGKVCLIRPGQAMRCEEPIGLFCLEPQQANGDILPHTSCFPL